MDNLIIAAAVRRREMRRRRRALKITRRRLRDTSNVYELPTERFLELFRFPQFWVQALVNMLVPFLPRTTRVTAISPHTKVLTALLFYATGSYQRTTGEDYNLGLSQSAVSLVIHQVTEHAYKTSMATTYRQLLRVR